MPRDPAPSLADRPLAQAEASRDGAPKDWAPVGRVDALIGGATVLHDGTTTSLAPGAPVYQRDLIATQPGAKLALVFADKTAFALGESGRLRVDEMHYDPAATGGKIAISVFSGAFAFAAGDIAASQADAMTVRTPVGTIGVRGTLVGGHVDPAGDSSFSALPDLTGAPSVVAFTNGAGTRLLTDNTTISVQGFFTPPGAPSQLAAFGEAGDLAAIASTLSATISPGGGGADAAPSVSAAPSGDPGYPGASPGFAAAPPLTTEPANSLQPDHLTLPTSDPAPAFPAEAPGHAHPLDNAPGAFAPEAPGHAHPLDNAPGAFAPASGAAAPHSGAAGPTTATAPPSVAPADPPSGAMPAHDPPHGHHFIGTLGQDVFHGGRGPNLFDFVTVPNSLQSGDSIDGGGGNDTLIAAFNAPFAIDHTLSVVNVPLVEITLPGGANSFDASNVSGVSSLTLHGPGNTSLTGGGGIGALVVTDPGHHDTLGGFAEITYQNLGDPTGLHPTTVDLIDVPAAGTRINFLGNHPGDTLTVQGLNEASVTVSGAEQISSEADCHFTVAGTPDHDLKITLGGNASTVAFDTAGPVTASVSGAGHAMVGVLVGSAFNDVITTTDDGVYAIFGGGGSDTVHLGGTNYNAVAVEGINTVDLVSGHQPIRSFVEATDWGQTASFDLGGSGYLTLISDHPTSVEFSSTDVVGAVRLSGVSTLELQGAAFNVTFDNNMDFGSRLDFYAFNLHTALRLDASRATGQLDVYAYDSLGSTFVGTRSDVLLYTDSSGPGPQITLDDFGGSALSGSVRLGSAAIDHFTNFGTISWGGEFPYSGSLVIDNAARISVVDLDKGQVSGAGGVAWIGTLQNLTNLTDVSLDLRVRNYNEFGATLIAGSGEDTLTGYGGRDLLVGGTGADHFVFQSAVDSRNLYFVDTPGWYQILGPDVIQNFHDSGTNTSVLDVAAVSAVTQHLTGDKGTYTTGFSTVFATAFANDHAGDIDYVTFAIPGNTGPAASHTFVHVASGAGYSASDLIVDLQGAHTLTAANFHLHA